MTEMRITTKLSIAVNADADKYHNVYHNVGTLTGERKVSNGRFIGWLPVKFDW